MRTTHTEAELPVPPEIVEFIGERLRAAGYTDNLNHDGTISMHGLALAADPTLPMPSIEHLQLLEMLGVTSHSEAAGRIGVLLGIAMEHKEGPYAEGGA